MSARHRVVVAGATGLVGGACVRAMLADPSFEVVALVRRAGALPAARRLRLEVVDFERLVATGAGALEGAHAIVCALGTTIRAAGSQAAFRRVDHDYPVALARLGRTAGVEHFGLVSAIGAARASRVFYNRVKGEVEFDVGALGYPSLAIARPSLLLGARAEFRPLEALMGLAGAIAPPAWRPVPAEAVAAALVRRAGARRPGTDILENDLLRREWSLSHGARGGSS